MLTNVYLLVLFRFGQLINILNHSKWEVFCKHALLLSALTFSVDGLKQIDGDMLKWQNLQLDKEVSLSCFYQPNYFQIIYNRDKPINKTTLHSP